MRTFTFTFVLALVACGTSSPTNGDGGCIAATDGDACSASDFACSLGDACCNGTFVCQSGHWHKEFPGCACQMSTFTCGTLMCESGQYCEEDLSGVDGGAATNYCQPLPSACVSDQTCACLDQGHVCSSASCDASQGHLSVVCPGA